MAHLSVSAKEAIVKKALGLRESGVQEIAKQHNVGFSSLQRWIRQYKATTSNQFDKNNSIGKLSRQDKLQHILATATLDEQAIGVYCRERGLYAMQLTEWKNDIMLDKHDEKYQTLLQDIKALRLENKELKQNINRKDRALAETTALLVLKKKVNAILGDPEDD